MGRCERKEKEPKPPPRLGKFGKFFEAREQHQKTQEQSKEKGVEKASMPQDISISPAKEKGKHICIRQDGTKHREKPEFQGHFFPGECLTQSKSNNCMGDGRSHPFSFFPFAYCPLPIAYNLSPIAHTQLPIAFI
jgi:hypothetical protein